MWTSIICLLALVAANVESLFSLPPSIRGPLYDVFFQLEPLGDTSPSHLSSQLVSLQFDEIPIQCSIPAASNNSSGIVMSPLADNDTIEKAREVLTELHKYSLVSIDDVWAWVIDFSTGAKQCLPNRDDAPNFTLPPNSFQVVIGSAGEAEGHNLRTAEPVVVNDKHMLMATYSNGSFCDLARGNRTTRLFFTCDPQAKAPKLLNVDEPYACVYEFQIGLDTLCSIPEFRDPQRLPNNIICWPDQKLASSADMEHFRNYMDYADETFNESDTIFVVDENTTGQINDDTRSEHVEEELTKNNGDFLADGTADVGNNEGGISSLNNVAVDPENSAGHPEGSSDNLNAKFTESLDDAGMYTKHENENENENENEMSFEHEESHNSDGSPQPSLENLQEPTLSIISGDEVLTSFAQEIRDFLSSNEGQDEDIRNEINVLMENLGLAVDENSILDLLHPSYSEEEPSTDSKVSTEATYIYHQEL